MIDSKFRIKYQQFLIEPLLKLPWIARCSPTFFTLLGLALGIAVALFLVWDFPLLSLVCLILSGFLDTLDGSLARHLQQTSNQGAVLDITSDRLVEFAIVMGLYSVAPTERGFPCLLILGSILLCITTFLVVGIFSQNETEKSFYYSPGIIERAEAFIFFAVMILLPSAFFLLAMLFSILVAVTGVVRIFQFMRLSVQISSEKFNTKETKNKI